MGIGDWLLQLFGAIGAGSSLVSLVSTIHYLRRVPGVRGAVVVVGDRIGLCGGVEIVA